MVFVLDKINAILMLININFKSFYFSFRIISGNHLKQTLSSCILLFLHVVSLCFLNLNLDYLLQCTEKSLDCKVKFEKENKKMNEK